MPNNLLENLRRGLSADPLPLCGSRLPDGQCQETNQPCTPLFDDFGPLCPKPLKVKRNSLKKPAETKTSTFMKPIIS